MEALTGVILAGGKSTRFGSDKASALLAGRPLLDRVAAALATVTERLVVVRARGQVLPPVNVSVTLAVVEDFVDGEGPLAGLIAGFRATTTPLAFATSCDAPLLVPALAGLLAAELSQADAAVPEVGGRLQPLVAVYRVEPALRAFEEAFAEGERSLTGALQRLAVSRVEETVIRRVDADLLSFRNINRPELMAEVEGLLARGEGASGAG